MPSYVIKSEKNILLWTGGSAIKRIEYYESLLLGTRGVAEWNEYVVIISKFFSFRKNPDVIDRLKIKHIDAIFYEHDVDVVKIIAGIVFLIFGVSNILFVEEQVLLFISVSFFLILGIMLIANSVKLKVTFLQRLNWPICSSLEFLVIFSLKDLNKGRELAKELNKLVAATKIKVDSSEEYINYLQSFEDNI